MKNLFVTCVSIFAVACAFTGTACAQSAHVAQRVVSYADLDLNKPEGGAILLSRLQLASRQVCGSEPDMRDLDGHGLYATCVKTAMDNSLRSVPSLLVKNIYMDAPNASASQELASK
jgi:UrcA family protein